MGIPMTGTYRHNIDGKNRIFLPAKHRESIGDVLIIYPSLHDRSLKYRSLEEWSRVEEQIEALPALQREEASRFFYENSDTLSPDSQGRIVINQTLAEYAGIDREAGAVIVGCGRYGEIWAVSEYESMKMKQDVERLRLNLASFGM